VAQCTATAQGPRHNIWKGHRAMHRTPSAHTRRAPSRTQCRHPQGAPHAEPGLPLLCSKRAARSHRPPPYACARAHTHTPCTSVRCPSRHAASVAAVRVEPRCRRQAEERREQRDVRQARVSRGQEAKEGGCCKSRNSIFGLRKALPSTGRHPRELQELHELHEWRTRNMVSVQQGWCVKGRRRCAQTLVCQGLLGARSLYDVEGGTMDRTMLKVAQWTVRC